MLSKRKEKGKTQNKIFKFTSEEKSPFGFIERPENYKCKLLSEVRRDITTEIGDLIPSNFNFMLMGMPVSQIQEDSLVLKRCIMRPVNDDEVTTVQLKIRPATTNTSMTRPSSKHSTPGPATRISSPIRFENKAVSMSKQQLQPRPGADWEGAVERTVEVSRKAVEALEEDLHLEKAKLESLKLKPPPRPWVGTTKLTCSHCHNKGHKANKPCRLSPCKGYHICGNLDLHEEHKKLKNEAESKVRRIQKQLQEKRDELQSLEMLKERTKANFFSVVRPRLLSCNPVKYSNKAELHKDLLLLAAKLQHKVLSESFDLELAIAEQKGKSAQYRDTLSKEHDETTDLPYYNDNSDTRKTLTDFNSRQRGHDLTRYDPHSLRPTRKSMQRQEIPLSTHQTPRFSYSAGKIAERERYYVDSSCGPRDHDVNSLNTAQKHRYTPYSSKPAAKRSLQPFTRVVDTSRLPLRKSTESSGVISEKIHLSLLGKI